MLSGWATFFVLVVPIVPVLSTQGQGFRDVWQNVLSQQIRELVGSSAMNVTSDLANSSTTVQNFTFNSNSDTVTQNTDIIRVTSPETGFLQTFQSGDVGVDILQTPRTADTTVSDIAESEHSRMVESSSVAHVRAGEVLEAIRPLSDAKSQLEDPSLSQRESNPSIRQLEEPVAPPSEDTRERGSLPLVLGAAIVVIFGFGVSGAAITATCRKRKLKKKGDVETTNSGDIGLHTAGKSNSLRSDISPVFTVPDKQRNALSLALSTFPPNSSIYKDMKFVSPTVSPH